ncbi:MAG: ATP synthase F1 subunit epsilon [Bacteroidales bacterium]|jgi:F-type H+-transporting ATPase subunit epsilon
MLLEIITPDKKIFSGEVSLVQLPGTDGSFEILNNHAPIISTLGKGKIKIINAAKTTQYFEINSGVVEMQKNKIIVLAE